jgi:DNA polymerase-1
VRLYAGVRLLSRPSPANVLRLDLACLPLVTRMNRNGIYLNPTVLSDLEVKLRMRLAELEAEILPWSSETDFNPGSADQVARLLFDDLKLEVPAGAKLTRSRARVSVDDDTLSAMLDQCPVVRSLQDWRESAKLLTTYVLPLPKLRGPDGRIRGRIKNTSTRTGRFSYEDPNLQQIPVRSELGREVRAAFQASRPNTVLASIDLSQIEMVMAAHESQDPTMMGVFWNGEDIHLRTVAAVFGYDYPTLMQQWGRYKDGLLSGGELAAMKGLEQAQRLPLKQAGFGVLYGQLAQGLQLSILSVGGPFIALDTCDRYIEDWFGTYTGVWDWMEHQHERARRYGMVWDIFGRHRPIPGVRSALQGVVNKALRECGNHPIQSGSAGILKLGMAEVDEAVEMYEETYPSEVCLPLLMAHDELLFELSRPIAEEFVELAKGIMENVVPLSVPVRATAKIGRSWKELK